MSMDGVLQLDDVEEHLVHESFVVDTREWVLHRLSFPRSLIPRFFPRLLTPCMRAPVSLFSPPVTRTTLSVG